MNQNTFQKASHPSFTSIQYIKFIKATPHFAFANVHSCVSVCQELLYR